jgi:hypothetical protein
MEMRLIALRHEDRDGATKRVVLTTLLDNATYDWIELGELYETRRRQRPKEAWREPSTRCSIESC